MRNKFVYSGATVVLWRPDASPEENARVRQKAVDGQDHILGVFAASSRFCFYKACGPGPSVGQRVLSLANIASEEND